jgi:starch synthase (maltosyl-transferring)
MEHVPREPGSEEYRDSEKYEIRAWQRDRADSLRPLIAQVNAIRHANRALHRNERLCFHTIDNPQLICYSKSTEDFDNVILTIVNLDPRNRQSGWADLSLADLGLVSASEASERAVPLGTPIVFEVHDLLTDARYRWEGPRNYVELRPDELPAHVFRVQAGSVSPR